MASGCQFVGNGWSGCTGRVQGTDGLLDIGKAVLGFVSPVIGTVVDVIGRRRPTGGQPSQGPLQTATDQATRTVQESDTTKTLLIVAGVGLVVYLLATRRR